MIEVKNSDEHKTRYDKGTRRVCVEKPGSKLER